MYLQLINIKINLIAGNMGQIANSGSRFFWGYMMDVVPFKFIAIAMATIQLCVAGFISLCTSSEILY